MKYGLLVFKGTDNIGDDIQTYAAEAFLPSVDYYIDRESLNVFRTENGEKVAVIMNAWYMYNKYTLPPSPHIYPLFIAVHFSKSDYFRIEEDCLDARLREYFKQFGEVGCRDNNTRKIFLNKGISSFFSGCLTLTIEPQNMIGKNNTIYCVDVDEKIVNKVKTLNKVCKVEKISHDIEPDEKNFSWSNRKKRVEDLLEKYQSAYCVVTTRLHCALPCLALGTPVLLIYKEGEYFKNRIEDFLPFLHYCSEKDFLEGNANYDINNPPPNSEEFKILKSKIKKRVIEFIETTKKQKIVENVIPEYWYNQLVWQSDLLKNQLPKLKELHDKAWERDKLIKKVDWQHEEIQWLTKKVEGTENYYKKREEWMESQLSLQKQKLERQIIVEKEKSEKEKVKIESLEKNLLKAQKMNQELAQEQENTFNNYIQIKNSITYKIGRAFLYMPKKLFAFFRLNNR